MNKTEKALKDAIETMKGIVSEGNYGYEVAEDCLERIWEVFPELKPKDWRSTSEIFQQTKGK
jgi:hypothetical protein